MYAISDRHRDEIIAMLTAFASLAGGDRRAANLRRPRECPPHSALSGAQETDRRQF